MAYFKNLILFSNTKLPENVAGQTIHSDITGDMQAWQILMARRATETLSEMEDIILDKGCTV